MTDNNIKIIYREAPSFSLNLASSASVSSTPTGDYEILFTLDRMKPVSETLTPGDVPGEFKPTGEIELTAEKLVISGVRISRDTLLRLRDAITNTVETIDARTTK